MYPVSADMGVAVERKVHIIRGAKEGAYGASTQTSSIREYSTYVSEGYSYDLKDGKDVPYEVNEVIVEADETTGQVRLEARTKEIIEVDGLKFKDLNANGELDVYEDWRQEIDARVKDLMSQMTIEEEIGLLWHDTARGAARLLYRQDRLQERDGHQSRPVLVCPHQHRRVRHALEEPAAALEAPHL